MQSDSARPLVQSDPPEIARALNRFWYLAAAVMLCGVIATMVCIFFPLLRWDARRMIAEASTGTYTDWQCPPLGWYWYLADSMAGDAGVFVAQFAPLWIGVGILGFQLLRDGLIVGTFLPLALLLPPVFAPLGLLEKDLMLGSVLMLVVACQSINRENSPMPRTIRGVALALSFLTLSFRINALFAVLPLVCCALAREGRPKVRGVLRVGVVAAGLWFLNVVFVRIVFDPKPAYISRFSMLHDIVAIHYPEVRPDLFPRADVESQSFSVDAVVKKFNPFSVDSLFWQPTNPFGTTPGRLIDEKYMGDLRARWVNEIIGHPFRYLAHRLKMFWEFVSFGPRMHLTWVQIFRSYAPSGRSMEDEIRLMYRSFELWVPRVYSILLWFALAGAALFLQKRFARPHRFEKIQWALFISAACYTLSFFVILPALHFRYLWWPSLACILVLLLSVAAFLAPLKCPHATNRK